MIRGLYSCANGLLAESTRNDVIASNLAGLSVPGFKRDIASVSAFGRTLEYLAGGGGGIVGPSALLSPATTVDLRPGPIRSTGNDLDLALDGPGYFCVQAAGGEAYTRGGAFRVDSAGRLVTAEGDPVLGVAGPIRIGGAKAQIAENGDVLVDGGRIDRLKLADFSGGAEVMKLGNGLLRLSSGTASVRAAGRVQQGYLEEPNVNAVTELASMISALRAFEASQRALQANDQTLDKAINEVGRV